MNRAERATPADDIVALIEYRARIDPHRLAVVDDTVALSYWELLDRATALAGALRGAVAGSSRRRMVVPIVAERSARLIVGMLGALKAGLAYTIADLAAPRERLAFIVGDVDAPALVADAAGRRMLPAGFSAPVLDLDDRLVGVPASPDLPVSPPGALAYVLYTSGSTGRPKGVLVRRSGLTNYCQWQRQAMRITEADRASQLAALAFDGSNCEIWPYLCSGASVHIAADALRVEPHELVRWLRSRRITRTFAPTPLAELLLVEPGIETTHLRTLKVGGDVLRARPRAGMPFEVWNLYGPTETTVASTYAVVPPGPGGQPAPVGVPIAHTSVYVLDDALVPVPLDEEGELYIGGAGVAYGYLGQSGLTAQRFLPDPFAAVSGAVMYRTGDLGRRLGDGTLVVTGRIDTQVKIRGYRVEPGEIEAILLRHPAVRAAAVVARGPHASRMFVAHVVPAEPGGLSEADLREHAATSLPGYLVPSGVVLHDALPLTSRGKVDRAALAAIPAMPTATGRAAGDSTGGTGERIVHWCRELGLTDADAGTSFLACGGNSLLAAQLAGRVRRELGVALTAAAIISAPSLGCLTDSSGAAEPSGPPPGIARPSGAPEGAPVEAPLSHQQEAVWFLTQLHPRMRAYNFQCAVHISGPLRADLIGRAVDAVTERHEILRTTFEESEAGPRQRVHPSYRHHIPVIDLTDLPSGERDQRLSQITAEAVRHTFDVGSLPLIRWSLVRLAPDEHVLIQVEHHFIHDGWSLGVLWREIIECYAAWAAGGEPALPPLPVQYADYAQWQRAPGTGARLERQLRYWEDRLAGLPSLPDLPDCLSRPPRFTFRGAIHRFDLDPGLYARLREHGRSEGVSLFATMLAAFTLLIHLRTGTTDVPIGSAFANRAQPEIQPLIGMFVNTVVLRSVVDPAANLKQLAASVHETVLAALNHEEAPFPAVVQRLGGVRDRSRNPLVQVCFSFHDSPVPVIRLGEATGHLVEHGNGTAKFDLNIIAIPRAEQQLSAPAPSPEAHRLTMVWEYCTDVLDADLVEGLSREYLRLLALLVAEPDRTVGSLATRPRPDRPDRTPATPVPSAAPPPAGDAAAAQPGRAPLESLLKSVWSEVLGVAVRPGDDFFELGGHSLLAMGIVSRVRREHGIEIGVSDIFDTPTVAGLAGRLSERIKNRAASL